MANIITYQHKIYLTAFSIEIVRECPFKSGYQPRPAVPPSAGWALSVLVAVCAVLWVWWMLPQLWPQLNTNASKSTVAELLALLLGNCAVFWWTTRPMWQNPRLHSREEFKRSFVLVLSVFFHLASLDLALVLVKLGSGLAINGRGGF